MGKGMRNIQFVALFFGCATIVFFLVALTHVADVIPLIAVSHQWHLMVLFSLVGLSLAGLVVCGALMNRYWRQAILLPLIETRHFAEQVAEGQLDAQISGQSHAEISLLRKAIVHMAKSLRVRMDALEQAEMLASSRAAEAQEARMRAEEGLIIAKDASRTKSEFLARMSHEIRTPMNAVIGMSYLCLQKELGDTQKEYVSKIHTAGKNLLSIINDILDYSRIEAGKMRVNNAPFRMQALLDSLSTVVASRSTQKEVETLFQVSNSVPRVLVGDLLRLTQVMSNLASNAYKFTSQGEIVISVTLREDLGEQVRLRFSVQDTGAGISSDQQEFIFQSFRQVDSSMTRKQGGVGLGLSIVSHLVALMGSEIKVNSTLGVGSIFYFDLLMLKGDEKALPTTINQVSFAGMRVLVVDDSATARKIFTDMLEHLEMRVTAVNSGEAALTVLDEDTDFALIVLDWKMGGIDGVETLRRIRARTGMSSQPPVILASAYNVDDVYSHCEHISNVCVLAKPINYSVFFENVCASLGNNSRQSVPMKHVAKDVKDLRCLSGAQVLVVEDNEFNQQIACEMLERVGVHVTVVENGLEGLNAALTGEYDLVLMDVQMPVMDGLEATRRIRAAGMSMAELPIVTLTAHASSHDREKSLQAGVNEHLTKPVSAENLYGTLAHWLQGKTRKSGLSSSHVGLQATVSSTPSTAQYHALQGKNSSTNAASTTSSEGREASVATASTAGASVEASAGASMVGTGGFAQDAAAIVTLPTTLPGLNVRSGLANVVQNKALYLNLLCRFVDKYNGSTLEFVELLNRQDMEAASRLAHTIKGVAANLGAMDLATAARGIELDLSATGTLGNSMPEYEQQMEILLQSVNLLAPHCSVHSTRGGTAKDGVDTATAEQKNALHEMLEGIAERMQLDWGTVCDQLTDHLPLWLNSPFGEDFKAVLRAVEDFDATAVHDKAEQLRRRLSLQ